MTRKLTEAEEDSLGDLVEEYGTMRMDGRHSRDEIRGAYQSIVNHVQSLLAPEWLDCACLYLEAEERGCIQCIQGGTEPTLYEWHDGRWYSHQDSESRTTHEVAKRHGLFCRLPDTLPDPPKETP